MSNLYKLKNRKQVKKPVTDKQIEAYYDKVDATLAERQKVQKNIEKGIFVQQ